MSRKRDMAERRAQRKQDLLLASGLARLEAADAFNQMAERADSVGDRVRQARALLANPAVKLAGTALGAALLGFALRRRRTPARGRGIVSRLARWGWLGWRVWRASAPLMARWHESSRAAD